MLEIRNLRKAFGPLQVLKGIDLDVNKGDVVAILGSSGSGKTTMLRCLNFLERADAGTMDFDGRRIELHRATHAEINALRRRTGFVFQYGLLSGGLSGSDPEGDCFGPLPDPAGQRDHIDVVCSLLFAYENIRVRRNGLRKRLFRIDEEFAVACAGVGIEGNLQFVLLPF